MYIFHPNLNTGLLTNLKRFKIFLFNAMWVIGYCRSLLLTSFTCFKMYKVSLKSLSHKILVIVQTPNILRCVFLKPCFWKPIIWIVQHKMLEIVAKCSFQKFLKISLFLLSFFMVWSMYLERVKFKYRWITS